MPKELRQLVVDKQPVPGNTKDTLTVKEALALAGRDASRCDVFLLKNEGAEGTKVPLSHVLDLSKPTGQPVRLRCVPNDRNVGAVA